MSDSPDSGDSPSIFRSLSREDLEEIISRGLRLAYSLLGDRLLRGKTFDDYVHDALLKMETGTRTWTEETILEDLIGAIRSDIGHGWKKARGVDPRHVDELPQRHADHAGVVESENVILELKSLVADDDDALELLDHWTRSPRRKGDWIPGWSRRRQYNATRRLKRAVLRRTVIPRS